MQLTHHLLRVYCFTSFCGQNVTAQGSTVFLIKTKVSPWLSCRVPDVLADALSSGAMTPGSKAVDHGVAENNFFFTVEVRCGFVEDRADGDLIAHPMEFVALPRDRVDWRYEPCSLEVFVASNGVVNKKGFMGCHPNNFKYVISTDLFDGGRLVAACGNCRQTGQGEEENNCSDASLHPDPFSYNRRIIWHGSTSCCGKMPEAGMRAQYLALSRDQRA